MTNSLLPPSTTPLERDVEQATDRTVEVPFDALWDANRIPAHLLPWLAWALGVRQWSDAWSEQRKRDEVAAALTIRRHAGTLGALRQVINTQGVDGADIAEWFDYAGQPGHFRLVLDLDGVGISQKSYDELITGINRAKRLSAHFDPTQISTTARGNIRLGAGKLASTTITLTPYRLRQLAVPGPTTIGTGQHGSSNTTLYPG
ncbi:phage tail protein I [Vreelandella alkaliphila]|uniref:phage tail protein I n=1 Tax=Vreelandella alkaliphila TaxID=272774 RepID=UPI003FD7E259